MQHTILAVPKALDVRMTFKKARPALYLCRSAVPRFSGGTILSLGFPLSSL